MNILRQATFNGYHWILLLAFIMTAEFTITAIHLLVSGVIFLIGTFAATKVAIKEKAKQRRADTGYAMQAAMFYMQDKPLDFLPTPTPQLVKRYRTNKGWTQEQLAKKIGLQTGSHISEFETGVGSISEKALKKLTVEMYA